MKRCYACDLPIKVGRVQIAFTSDGQKQFVGSNCFKKIASMKEGYQPPKGGPRMFLKRPNVQPNLDFGACPYCKAALNGSMACPSCGMFLGGNVRH